MELPWDLGLLSGLLESVVSFCSEFAHDWGANDMRVTIFKLLLGWLVCSLVAIHMAWKYYGATVNDMYYRQGSGGQNGGTPDGSSNFAHWENASGESFKSHKEKESQQHYSKDIL